MSIVNERLAALTKLLNSPNTDTTVDLDNIFLFPVGNTRAKVSINDQNIEVSHLGTRVDLGDKRNLNNKPEIIRALLEAATNHSRYRAKGHEHLLSCLEIPIGVFMSVDKGLKHELKKFLEVNSELLKKINYVSMYDYAKMNLEDMAKLSLAELIEDTQTALSGASENLSEKEYKDLLETLFHLRDLFAKRLRILVNDPNKLIQIKDSLKKFHIKDQDWKDLRLFSQNKPEKFAYSNRYYSVIEGELDPLSLNGFGRVYNTCYPFAHPERPGIDAEIAKDYGDYSASWVEQRKNINYFLESITNERAKKRLDAINTLSQSKDLDEIIAEYKKHFGARITTNQRANFTSGGNHYRAPNEKEYEDLELGNNFFEGYFRNSKFEAERVLGKPSYVGYPYNGLNKTVTWLEAKCHALGAKSDYFSDLSRKLASFKKTKGYKEALAVIASFENPGRGISHEMRPDRSSGGKISSASERDGLDHIENFQWSMNQVFKRNYRDIKVFEKAMLEFELILTWAKFFSDAEIKHSSPKVSNESNKLRIKNGTNPTLSLKRESGLGLKEVQPNSLEFSPERQVIILSGANGGGKTQLLEMLANNTILSQKGLRVFAMEMETTPLSDMGYGVNLSLHGKTASAFMNEITKLKNIISNIESSRLGKEPALLILDEPFRGTSTIEAVPLLIGLMKYCQDRNIYLGFSTHFNSVARYTELFKKYAVTSGVFTMDRSTHTMIAGVGDSEGVNEAEKQGLDAEIVTYAKSINSQLKENSDSIQLAVPVSQVKTLNPNFKFRLEDLQEASIVSKDSLESKLSPGDMCSCLIDNLCLHESHFKDAFIKTLCKELTSGEKNERLGAINYLVERNDLTKQVATRLSSFNNFEVIFPVEQKKTSSSDKSMDAFTQAVGTVFSGKRIDLEYQDFLNAIKKHTPSRLFADLEVIKNLFNNHSIVAINDDIKTINDFCKSAAFQEIGVFASSNNLSSGLQQENWYKWNDLCVKHKLDLQKLEKALTNINFYITTVSTINNESWAKVSDAKSGLIKLEGGINKALDSNRDIDVNPVHLDLNPESPIKIISGTNGGGKSKALELIASLIFFNQQLGYIPATKKPSPELGHLPFFYAMISSSEHTDELSSFQSEIKKIQNLVAAYKQAGEPSGGMILLDEPFKGTSEEDAIPLLIGLMKYFEMRGVQVILSTHFTRIFDVLKKMDMSSSIKYQPLYVDYFSEGAGHFQLKEGEGSSSGIKVAEKLGLQKDIVSVASEIQRGFANSF